MYGVHISRNAGGLISRDRGEKIKDNVHAWEEGVRFRFARSIETTLKEAKILWF